MLNNIRNKQLNIKLTSLERNKFDNMFDLLRKECNISPKRQSEIIIEGFFQYAENLLASYVNHTHTKPQSLAVQRKEAIFSIIETIKEKGFISYAALYSELILCNDCFQSVKMRARSAGFQNLLVNEDLYLLNLSYYFNTQSKFPLFIIHKNSKWWCQLQSLCFKITQHVLKVTYDNLLDEKFKEILFDKIKHKSKYKSTLDKAERTMLNAFLYEVQYLADKPMYDFDDITLRDVIQLRSERKFNEALELLEQEKVFKQSQQMKTDEGIQLLEGLER